MKRPTFLKVNVDKDEALEIVNFLYGRFIDFISETPDNKILWIANGETVAKWTNEYKNIMISEDFVIFVHDETEKGR
jgi:hypothetical protein